MHCLGFWPESQGLNPNTPSLPVGTLVQEALRLTCFLNDSTTVNALSGSLARTSRTEKLSTWVLLLNRTVFRVEQLGSAQNQPAPWEMVGNQEFLFNASNNTVREGGRLALACLEPQA